MTIHFNRALNRWEFWLETPTVCIIFGWVGDESIPARLLDPRPWLWDWLVYRISHRQPLSPRIHP